VDAETTTIAPRRESNPRFVPGSTQASPGAGGARLATTDAGLSGADLVLTGAPGEHPAERPLELVVDELVEAFMWSGV
jgi:hypothetical protein